MASEELEHIVERCRQGEDLAFEELFRTIRSDVYRIAVRTVGPDSELDDIVQAAFLEIFRSVHKFKGESKFSTWMYRVVANVSLQYLRKRKTTPSPVDIGELANDLVSPDANPEVHSQQRERIEVVREILNEMVPKKRMVFLLHEVEGLNPDEIAERLGSSRFTVKSRLFYARKEFYRKIRRKSLLDFPGEFEK